MMLFLRTWIEGLIGAALFCPIATELAPKGGAKSVLKALCGIVLTSALILPLLKEDFSSYALDLSKMRQGASQITQNAEQTAQEYNRRVIEEKLEAYIMDKAQTLGTQIEECQVSLRWHTDGVWIPESIELKGIYSEKLAALIEGEIGIEKSQQRWSNYERP